MNRSYGWWPPAREKFPGQDTHASRRSFHRPSLWCQPLANPCTCCSWARWSQTPSCPSPSWISHAAVYGTAATCSMRSPLSSPVGQCSRGSAWSSSGKSAGENSTSSSLIILPRCRLWWGSSLLSIPRSFATSSPIMRSPGLSTYHWLTDSLCSCGKWTWPTKSRSTDFSYSLSRSSAVLFCCRSSSKYAL